MSLYQGGGVSPLSRWRRVSFTKVEACLLYQGGRRVSFTKEEVCLFTNVEVCLLYQGGGVSPLPRLRHVSFTKVETCLLYQGGGVSLTK